MTIQSMFVCIIFTIGISQTVLKANPSTPTNTFDNWLLNNEIQIPSSLRKKMENNFVASIGVLLELTKMGNSAIKAVLSDLQLNTIETAIFNFIISKLDNNNDDKCQVCICDQLQNQITSIVPEIISISDNKNGAINMKWKLNKVFNKNTMNKLQLEWSNNKDFNYRNDAYGVSEIDYFDLQLNNVYETKNIIIKNINANIFRLKWTDFSDTKTIEITTDRWDKDNKGQHIQVNNNVIRHTSTTVWNSIYGQVICKHPYTYHWQFKIKAFAIHFMFGVARISNGYNLKNGYLGQTEIGYYAAMSNDNAAHVYNTGSDYSGQYGIQRFNTNGCILDMYLDLKNYKLSFKTGGEYTGVTIDNLPQEEYRMIVSLYNKQQIELIAFDYN